MMQNNTSEATSEIDAKSKKQAKPSPNHFSKLSLVVQNFSGLSTQLYFGCLMFLQMALQPFSSLTKETFDYEFCFVSVNVARFMSNHCLVRHLK